MAHSKEALFLFVCYSFIFCVVNGYYWRDYYGITPDDAVPGGRDFNNNVRTYIGQVYIKQTENNAVVPTNIIPTEKNVFGPLKGGQQSSGFVQILCGNVNNFKWKIVTKSNFHEVTANDELVKAGSEGGRVLAIGRVKYGNQLIVGKVWDDSNGAILYFVDKNNNEQSASSYEVLVVTNNDEPISIKGHYWRPYSGKIPADVIPGGHDVNNQSTYIGQVYANALGIFPTNIVPGDDVVYAPFYGVHKVKGGFIQILCGDSPQWASVNKTHLHLQTLNNFLVRGGIEGRTDLYIGRVQNGNAQYVGKVWGGTNGDAALFYVNGELEETSADPYEVLVEQ